MKFYVSLLISFFVSLSAFAGQPFSNLDSFKNSLGFTKYYEQANKGRRLRIAVLDKGFFGYQEEIGRTLPQNTRYFAGPLQPPPPIPTPTSTQENDESRGDHGLKMAQILIGLLTDDLQAEQWEPELILYNTFGYTNLKASIDDMIANKVDLVLYSEVWEYGGNFDGTGFINAQINRATSEGIIWVNAAGNFALTTYNSRIKTLKDDWVQLPDQNNALELKCEGTGRTKCPVKIVLSWNDFKNDVDKGTNKDLDLALTDDLLNIIQTSSLTQTTEDADQPGFSKYPREIIQAELKPGTYYIRVKNRSKNFRDRDVLRITADGANLTMRSHSQDETLLNPADNSTVITVGASDSDRSSSSRRLGKPDIFAPSSLITEDGDEYRGSSNSAAIVAAGLALLKSNKPRWTRKDLLEAVLSNRQQDWNQRGLSLNVLAFGPTGPGCFMQAQLNPLPQNIVDVLSRGGVPVMTTASVRIMVPYDPVTLSPYLRRAYINDMIVALPQGGYGIFPRYAYVPPGAVEIFQRPYEAGLCYPTNGGTSGRKHFLLP